ncbi:MAG: Gfo/Idh/MocA family protein [Candidatus Hydrogenedentota bacterium]
MDLTRRQFIGTSAAAVAASAMTTKSAVGANDRISIALIGCGGRGRMVAGGMMSLGAQLTHLCDVHPERLDQTWAFLSGEQDAEPEMVKNAEEVLASDEVDAVVVATPDHWHAPLSVLACQAGKDVYVEKPHTHNIFECWKMEEAAEKYDRIVQVGVQNRSADYVMEARKRIADGELGDVPFVKVYNVKSGGPFNLDEPGEPPEGFDWNEWLGPVPTDWPYHQRLFGGGWMQYWDFTGGDLALDNPHQLDLAMMVMGDPGLPTSVRCLGGRYAHRGDDSERPDLQVVSWDFGDFIMTNDNTGFPAYMKKTDGGTREGDDFPYWPMNATRVEVYGEDRFMYIGRHGGGWQIMEADGEVVESMPGRVPDMPHHYQNFLDCVRNHEKPTADVAVTNPHNIMIHMANIAHRVGDVSLNYDAEAGQFDNGDANALIHPERREAFDVPEDV